MTTVSFIAETSSFSHQVLMKRVKVIVKSIKAIYLQGKLAIPG